MVWVDVLDHSVSMRLGLQGVLPTGSYSPRRLISTGQDVWQISPYYAFTVHATERWEVSGRLVYDWSSRNTHPSDSLSALSAQPGAQLALNLSASYALTDHWRVGVASYMLRQLDNSRIDDRSVAGSEEQAFAVGPGVLWTPGSVTFLGNIYREFATQNRTEGFSGVLRLLYPF